MPAAAAVGNEAEGGEALDEFGGPGGNDDVAGKRDVGAGAGGDSVDAGDHRLRHGRETADQRVPAGLDGIAEIDGFAGGDRAVIQILAGAKAAAGAGEDDDPRLLRFIE